MIVSLEDFHRFIAAAGLIADEVQRAEEEASLRDAEAYLRAKLAKRYQLPQNISNLPQHTQDYLRKLVRALALRELFEKRAVRIPEGMEYPFEGIAEELDEIINGDIILDGVPLRHYLIGIYNLPLLKDAEHDN